MIKTPPEYCDYEWLELKPKGVVFEGHHFVFLLENSRHSMTLPLRFPVTNADLLAGSTLKSLWRQSLSFVSQELSQALGLRFLRCVFIRADAGGHRVKIFYKNQDVERFVEENIENVLGLCLEAELPFYATKSYLKNAQVSDPKSEIFLVNQKWTESRQKYLM